MYTRKPLPLNRRWVTFALGALVAISTTASPRAQRASTPDLQGTWDTGTATPMTRPAPFASKSHFTREDADAWERDSFNRVLSGFSAEDKLASDLNDTYQETASLKVVDDLRTSLIVDPPNGQFPEAVPAAKARADARPKKNYDDPETLSLDERCLMAMVGGSSAAAPPLVPNPFGQNLYQIVQTPDRVMIHTEMFHETRVIRIGGTHLPESVRSWAGDSIGHWEGDTLVVDTTNFRRETHYRNSSERMHVVERFTRVSPDRIRYRVTVEDPETWAAPWTAEIPFRATTDQIFEYACHEGSLTIQNYMRGARDEERRGVVRTPR
ncbi:MAG: hypothetical protein U0Q55_02055 [Vicinamibacterales bacterium]